LHPFGRILITPYIRIFDKQQKTAIIYTRLIFVGNHIMRKGGERRMKKTLSAKTLAKEASFWDSLKQSTKEHPGKTCHK
jgi:hypothetical protein